MLAGASPTYLGRNPCKRSPCEGRHPPSLLAVELGDELRRGCLSVDQPRSLDAACQCLQDSRLRAFSPVVRSRFRPVSPSTVRTPRHFGRQSAAARNHAPRHLGSPTASPTPHAPACPGV